MYSTKDELIEVIRSNNSYEIFKNLIIRLDGYIPHHHNHILYDIRTLLGNKQKIYTEVGKSTMSTACLLLQHEYNTKINCIGNLKFFENQSEIISRNTNNSNKFNYDVKIYDINPIDNYLINYLRETNFKTDILFIIENVYETVKLIIDIYAEFVNPEGYIVIDNYNDYYWSPKIKQSVNDFISTIDHGKYKIIGCLPNITNAFINLNINEYNSFIIKKILPENTIIENTIINNKLIFNQIKFCIIVATYNRSNGKTPFYIKKCIDSVINQTYTIWDIIIVGDKYEPENEIIAIINEFKSKLKKNNDIVYLKNEKSERDFIENKNKLWNIAGANSMNIGLKYCRNNGYKYYCHIDDDDYWHIEHLENFYNIYNTYNNCIFSNSKSTCLDFVLPNIDIDVYPNNILPQCSQICHSSISFRIDIIPFYYYSTEIESEIDLPADGKMLNQIQDFIINNPQYCSIFTNKLTCYHDIEGEINN